MSNENETRPRNNLETFLLAWQGSESIEEVAEKLNVCKASVYQRACKLRKHGIQIKQFERAGGRGPRKITTAEMAATLERVNEALGITPQEGDVVEAE